jgi:hypothetical protein
MEVKTVGYITCKFWYSCVELQVQLLPIPLSPHLAPSIGKMDIIQLSHDNNGAFQLSL